MLHSLSLAACALCVVAAAQDAITCNLEEAMINATTWPLVREDLAGRGARAEEPQASPRRRGAVAAAPPPLWPRGAAAVTTCRKDAPPPSDAGSPRAAAAPPQKRGCRGRPPREVGPQHHRSLLAGLCGKNRGLFVTDPPDGGVYGCGAFPTSWAPNDVVKHCAAPDSTCAVKTWDANAVVQQYDCGVGIVARRSPFGLVLAGLAFFTDLATRPRAHERRFFAGTTAAT